MKSLCLAALLCTACASTEPPDPPWAETYRAFAVLVQEQVAAGTPWAETYRAFAVLVQEQVAAGTITPAQADFVLRDYARRLWLEQAQADAAADAANSARLGNALGVWRTYFGPQPLR